MANRMFVQKLHRLTLVRKGKGVAKHPDMREGVLEVVKSSPGGSASALTKRLSAIEEGRNQHYTLVRLDSPVSFNDWDLSNLDEEDPRRLIELTIGDRDIEAKVMEAWYGKDGVVRLAIQPRTKVVKAAPGGIASVVTGTPGLDRFRRGWQ